MNGIVYAVAAYAAWGFFPVYWKLLRHLAAAEILAHRMLWSAVFFLALMLYRHRGTALAELRTCLRSWKLLALSGALVGGNWYTYIHAVNTGQVLEASLGYFINPLVSIGLGAVVFRERLNRPQSIAVGLAALGVVELMARAMLLSGGRPPFLALYLAFSFAFYGLIRKRTEGPPIAASTLESVFLALPVLAIASTRLIGGGSIAYSPRDWFLLVVGGVVTGLPLLWFAEAAQRLPLSTLGLLQYLAPTFQFLLAVAVYREPFDLTHLAGFALIWSALALYSVDLWRRTSKARRRAR